MDTMLTVFTPTYNRKEKLGSVYSSLIDQTDKDFIWMIVDDGSDDGKTAANTRRIILPLTTARPIICSWPLTPTTLCRGTPSPK